MNCVTFIGHLGNNPEAKNIDNGTTLARFSIATNRRWTQDGERRQRTDWHCIVAFGPRAKICIEHIGKGSHVAIKGELRTSSWEAADGSDRRSVETAAKEVEFLDKLSQEAQHTELKQVLEKEKTLIDQERQTINRLSERFEEQAEGRRLESIQQMSRETEDVLEEEKGKDATLRDLGIISMLQQLKAQEKSTLRALLTHAEEIESKTTCAASSRYSNARISPTRS